MLQKNLLQLSLGHIVNAVFIAVIGGLAVDGFNQLHAKNSLHLSLEALVVDKRFTALFTDEEANEALMRLLEVGYNFK